MSLFALVAMLAVVATGCSESGGLRLVAEAQPEEVAFGVARPDKPTTKNLLLRKPFVPSADVTLVSFAGPFAPAAGSLPTPSGTGIDFFLNVSFNPALLTGAQVATGTIVLAYTPVGSNTPVETTYNLTAVVEEPTINLTTPEINFGRTAIGERPSRVVQVFNPNEATPVQIVSAQYVGDAELDIDLTGLPLPLIIPPQESRRVPVVYTPAVDGAVSTGTVVLGTAVGDDLAGFAAPLSIDVRGEGMTGQEILREIFIDPSIAIDGSGLSQVICIDVPPETVAISFYAISDDTSDCLDFFRLWHDADGDMALDAPDEKLYTDDFFGPWLWFRGFPNGFPTSGLFATAISTQLPNSDATDAQLVPGGGQYCFILRAPPNASVDMRITIQKRNGGNVSEGTLKVNLLVASALPFDCLDALDEGNFNSQPLREGLDRADAILGTAGIRIGEIPVWDLPPDGVGFADYNDLPSFADVDSALREAAFDASCDGNFFFLSDLARLNVLMCNSLGGGDIDASAFSISGGTPCPKLDTPAILQTQHSGIVVQFTGLSSDELAYAIAHAIGSAMGLTQTVDGSGTFFDIIEDTLQCPAVGTNDTCTIEGANYVMHPFFLGTGQTLITAGQRRVMTRNMFMCPGRPLNPIFSGVLTGN